MFTVHCWHSVSMAVTSLTQISYRMISVSISVLSFIVAWQYANAITATIVLSVCPSVTLVSCDKTVERIDFLDRILPSVNAGLCCNGIHTARKRITYLPRNLNFLNSENLPFFFIFFIPPQVLQPNASATVASWWHWAPDFIYSAWPRYCRNKRSHVAEKPRLWLC